MRFLGVVFCCLLVRAGEQPRDLVRRAVETDERNQQVARCYSWEERQEQRQLDDDGRLLRRQAKTFQITIAGGFPYRRLVARDDKPLPPEDQKREQQNYDAAIAQAPAQSAARLAEWQAKRRKFHDTLSEVLDAFDFRLAGEEKVAGRDAYVIEGTPHPGFRPRSQTARLYPKLKGRLWIDKQDYCWLKAEAELIDTFAYGLVLARIQKGTRFFAEQEQVEDHVWLPKSVRASAVARIALVKKLNIRWEAAYRDYRKSQPEPSAITARADR